MTRILGTPRVDSLCFEHIYVALPYLCTQGGVPGKVPLFEGISRR